MNIRQAQLPQGWEIKKLGEVLVRTEMVDPTKNPDIEFTYLDVSSVNKETKEIEAANVLLGKDAPSRAKKLVRVNDVIFATVRPTHSRVAMIPEEYDGQVCSTGYFVLRGKENIFNKYLFYFLLSTEFNQQMEKLQKGASYPAVTDSEVKSIILRYPKSISEQQRIVSILDEAFVAIAKAKANAEQNLRNAKELFENYLQRVFDKKGDGWEHTRLGDICQIKDGTHFSPKNSLDGEYMYITAKNIKPYFIDLTKISYVSEKLHVEQIYLRATASNKSSIANFAFSTDNHHFQNLGNQLEMKFNLKVFTGNKVGLFNYATKASGGHVDFDWCRME